jgi:A/G-specific adenine glycosylase
MQATQFQQKLLSWFDEHGRKDLPWQQTISPYRVWLSEIMLQQTQVTTVIPYFQTFMAKFPTIETLAQAPVDDVLGLWSGLGYYARARNLHKSAQLIAARGAFPDTLESLLALPGIGLSTAGAIMSIAFQKSQPILDGNVKRVLARFCAVHGWSGDSAINKQLWEISTRLTPVQRVADYTQAIMDLGATVCTRRNPNCDACPLYEQCQARLTNTIALLPTSKASKKLPIKQLTLLLLQNATGQIWLEKRPSYGIWGGLWSVPEFSDIESAKNWCLSNNLSITNQHTLATKRHTFSHYHLDYTPVFIQTHDAIHSVMDVEQQLWCSAEQVNSLGLAAPVKLLLQQHFEQRE